MALLQRTRILANERLDLQDFNRIEDFICADFKAINKNIWANQNFVFSGFVSTGTGTNTLSIAVANSSLVVGQDDGVTYVGAPSLAPLATSSLTPGTTNYIELSVDQDTGGADSRAFWDPTAAGGAGAEFSQIVDTFTFLKADIHISTANFSGDADKVKICEVDVNGSGVITEIRDRRDLFWRLGRGTNIAYAHPWASRTEPVATQFTGADKDIKNLKQWADALMDGIREIKGTTYWYESAPVTLGGSFRNVGLSMLVANTGTAKFSWSGTQLEITDDNVTPLDADVLAYLRLFDSSVDLALTRQEGGNAISIANDQVLWIEIPDPLANTTYDSVGPIATNFRVSARGSVPLNDNVFWLAYRSGTRLYMRGLGELEAGEEHQITDDTTVALATFLGFDPETATSVPYTTLPSGSLPGQFTTNDTLVDAISANAENINYINSTINGNSYEEIVDVISAAPSNDNEITGPVTAGTIISLPLDSRDSNTAESYIVGKGTLELYLNGVYQLVGDDWLEVGSPGNASTQIEINVDLEVGDMLTFRQAVYGGFIGGGGGGSLQTAYSLGNTITTTPGNPLIVGGSATKVAVFNGDIDVTGVIDPKGITFSREASNPLPAGQDGFWVSATGEMMYTKHDEGDTNVSEILTNAGAAGANEIDLVNQSGSALSKLTPVKIDSLGYIAAIDVSVEADAFAAVGLASESIADTATGAIVTNGVLRDITTSATFGEALFVSKTGEVTNIKPSIGVGGFVSGDWIIKLGVIARNATAPAQKDLIVNLSVVGQL